MFENDLSSKQLDTTLPLFRRTVEALDKQYGFLSTTLARDITSIDDFPALQRATKEFYQGFFAEFHDNYVPLYHSLWKLRLKDVQNIANLHQDGGVHYFSKNGYKSRMITLWTNLHKDRIPGLSGSDMGVFVIDNKHPSNRALYERLAAYDSHFFVNQRGQLQDNMYVAGQIVKCDVAKLAKRYFDYHEGTSLSFNSHLLHGSKPIAGDLSRFPRQDLDKFRVSLTSVWLHKDDVNWPVLSMPDSEYESLCLSRHDAPTRAMVKETFKGACETEVKRLRSISTLIKEHTGAGP